MSDFVLVSQGIECDRSCNPYPIIKYAINGNRDYNKYLERCAENYERPADNEMFVYKEDRDNIEEVDLFMCEYLIRWAKEEAYDELADAIDEYKWISVEDKMPKDCNEDWVLILPYDGDFKCIPIVAEYRNGHWYGHTLCAEDDCIDGEGSPFEVRYWKPIYDEFHIAEQLKEQS